MQRFRKILVAIEGDLPAQGVLAHAARLAKQNGASIKLIAVVDDLPWYTRLVLPTSDELQDLLVRERSESLRKIADQLAQEGVTASAEVLRGRPHVEMVREVLQGGHDLLMKEASPNENVLFGSIDMHLLRDCPCPAWFVKPDHGDRPFARILASVDPSPPPDRTDLLHVKEDLSPKDVALDAKILELAGSLAALNGSDLHVLHAWSAAGEELLRGDMRLSPDQLDAYVEDSRLEAKKALDHLIAKVDDMSGRRSVHLIKGDPADVIADFAKAAQIDLIVMGTVGRTGIPGLLIGNSAESILQRVGCSVLAVKPDGFVSPVKVAD